MRRSINPSMDIDSFLLPRSNRTDTDRASASRSPTTIMYGIFCSSASRTLKPNFSLRMSAAARKPAFLSESRQLVRISLDLLAERQHADLLGREPERQHAAGMLDEHADEALQRSEDRAMDHHRTLLGAGAGGVREPETFRRRVVELNRRHLPLTLERIGHVDLDLRSVECALARIDLPCEAVAGQRVAESRLVRAPLLLGAHMMLGHRRNFEFDLLEAERRIDVVNHAQVHVDLGFDLVLGAVDMRVVLHQRAHPIQSVQRARALVAMEPAKIREANRQVAIRALLRRDT